MNLILFSFAVFLSQPVLSDDTPTPTEKAATVDTPKPIEKSDSPETNYAGEALAIKTRMDLLFEASRKINGKGVERTKAREVIERAMDWDKVAEKCLGTKKWKSESVANKSQFRNLLRDVIVKTAFTRLDKFWEGNTTYQFSKIDVNRNEAVVVSKFMVKGDAFALEYFLNKNGSNWFIWDIAYENERYSVNINEQIEAFLKEKGFATLLEKLKKRRADLDESASKKG